MIPNAPSIINAGYNPVVFAPGILPSEKEELKSLFSILGDCPEVAEEKLEAYAILTGMGPTYLWFQLYELQELCQSFGLSPPEIEQSLPKMVIGTIKTMFESGLSPQGVMDLIPVKPLGKEEETIKHAYRTNLEALYQKLTR